MSRFQESFERDVYRISTTYYPWKLLRPVLPLCLYYFENINTVLVLFAQARISSRW